jgi:hypothetical protein
MTNLIDRANSLLVVSVLIGATSFLTDSMTAKFSLVAISGALAGVSEQLIDTAKDNPQRRHFEKSLAEKSIS